MPTDQVIVAIPVSREIEGALRTEQQRQQAGRLLEEALRSKAELLRALQELGAEAQSAGVTQAMVDEEIAAHRDAPYILGAASRF